MIIKITHDDTEYPIDTTKAIDLSIPYNFNGDQPNFYDVEKGISTPLQTGKKNWSVVKGAGCNVLEVSFNIHCSGTHTECVGHLLGGSSNIGSILKDVFLPAVLVTVDPINFKNTNESYHCDIDENEYVITKELIKTQLEQWINFNPIALIIRTIPNRIEKQFYRFNVNVPPFFTNDALKYISQFKIEHLIVDIPSLDRMDDRGILGNHRLFWGASKISSNELDMESQKTITELAYIPNLVKDGIYLLNIQIPHFVCDAAPSRPFIYPI